MKTLLVVIIVLSVVIAYFALQEDRLNKGFKPNAKDGDKDGLIQDGTEWARKAKKNG